MVGEAAGALGAARVGADLRRRLVRPDAGLVDGLGAGLGRVRLEAAGGVALPLLLASACCRAMVASTAARASSSLICSVAWVLTGSLLLGGRCRRRAGARDSIATRVAIAWAASASNMLACSAASMRPARLATQPSPASCAA